MTIESLVRLGIAIIAAVALLMFLVRVNDDWKQMERGWKITRLCNAGLIFVSMEGSIELMLIKPPVPLGIRNVLLVGFLSGLLYGLWVIRKSPMPNNREDSACRFPGCIVARRDLRAAAAKYPSGIPPHLVLAIIDGVEAHEHQ